MFAADLLEGNDVGGYGPGDEARDLHLPLAVSFEIDANGAPGEVDAADRIAANVPTLDLEGVDVPSRLEARLLGRLEFAGRGIFNIVLRTFVDPMLRGLEVHVPAEVPGGDGNLARQRLGESEQHKKACCQISDHGRLPRLKVDHRE
ncbi:hypothetical protein [Rhizobium sp. TH2]|uniref:hypothetical protein n=1 Tax=Rhizobium sp. TH2 TaxID=2775403 RepID=UPI0021584B40|nr:hypothetical protein [Rhizobium sp. TH2]